MDTQQLNKYLNLVEALLHCAKGQEWLLLQQYENLIDSELLAVMEQVSNQLQAEGNIPAFQFLHYWQVQLTHLLEQQNTNLATPAASRSENYLKLVQMLLSCPKGDEMAVLSQYPELMDEGLVYTMNQVAAQLAAKGDQDIAIYLKHLAAEVNRVWLHPGAERSIATVPIPISSPSSNGHSEPPLHTAVEMASRHLDEERSTAIDPTPISLAPIEKHIDNELNELLGKIFSRLERLEMLLSKQSTVPNPLWYMPILEQVNAQAWIISSEEVEKLIGIKPSCAPGHNSFQRGCWKFIKTGKVGTHSSWRVIKETIALPTDTTPVSTGNESTPALSSPWSENS
jgi:hypothetical protein